MYSISEIKANLSADKDELKFKVLGGMAQELKMIMPEAFLSMGVLVDGKPILIPDQNGCMKSIVHQRSRSWTRNAYNQALSQLAGLPGPDNTFGAGKMNVKGTSGTVVYSTTVGVGLSQGYQGSSYWNWSDATSGYPQGYLCPAANASRGIVVGSGTNAESFEDYVLQTLIANGTGTGQLSYVQSEATVPSYDAGSKTFAAALARYFNNNSGGSVSVNEIGLYVYGGAGGNASTIICNSRDKLGSTVNIPNTGQLKVTYTISLVYPP
jgi:hypothetical protein